MSTVLPGWTVFAGETEDPPIASPLVNLNLKLVCQGQVPLLRTRQVLVNF